MSKLAFSQLFMSALDRAGRYGEQTFFIFINVENHAELADLVGEDKARDLTEFCLMLQRPRYESEPFDAARRFKKALAEYKSSIADPTMQPQLRLFMMDVPAGTLHFDRKF